MQRVSSSIRLGPISRHAKSICPAVVVDAGVVSELRKAKSGRADPAVVAWARSVQASELFVSAITIPELETGVLQIERREAVQGGLLRAWLDQQVLPGFTSRILAIDTAVARRCARRHVPDPRAERDALLAATALVHGLTVVTRNVADFAPTGVPILDPWGSAAMTAASSDARCANRTQKPAE